MVHKMTKAIAVKSNISTIVTKFICMEFHPCVIIKIGTGLKPPNAQGDNTIYRG